MFTYLNHHLSSIRILVFFLPFISFHRRLLWFIQKRIGNAACFLFHSSSSQNQVSLISTFLDKALNLFFIFLSRDADSSSPPPPLQKVTYALFCSFFIFKIMFIIEYLQKPWWNEFAINFASKLYVCLQIRCFWFMKLKLIINISSWNAVINKNDR